MGNDEVIDVPEIGNVYRDTICGAGEFECIGFDTDDWFLMKNLHDGCVSSYSEYGWKFVRKAS